MSFRPLYYDDAERVVVRYMVSSDSADNEALFR
jgi:hypothetical protein